MSVISPDLTPALDILVERVQDGGAGPNGSFTTLDSELIAAVNNVHL